MPYNPKNPFGLKPGKQGPAPDLDSEHPQALFQVARVGANTLDVIEPIANDLNVANAEAAFEVWYVYNYMDWLADMGISGWVNQRTDDRVHILLNDHTSIVSERNSRPFAPLKKEQVERAGNRPMEGSVHLWNTNGSWAEAARK